MVLPGPLAVAMRLPGLSARVNRSCYVLIARNAVFNGTAGFAGLLAAARAVFALLPVEGPGGLSVAGR